MSLEQLRERLDFIDDELVDLLSRRAQVVREIWEWKRANGVERFDPEREARLKARLLHKAGALGLDEAQVAAVLAQIVGKTFLP